MYKFLKENYGNNSMFAILAFAFSSVIGILLMIITMFSTQNKLIINGVVFFLFISILNGALMYLYLRKRVRKKRFRKIYFKIVIFVLSVMIVIYAPGLLCFNLVLRIPFGVGNFFKMLCRNKAYVCIFVLCLIRTIISFVADYPEVKSNYSIYAIEFICLYISLGLVWNTVIYFLFNDKETLKKHDNNIVYPYISFFNKSLYLIFCITLILNLIKYTIGFGNNQFSEVGTLLLNISSIIIAWKRVNDMNKKNTITCEKLENNTSINEHWREDVSNHLVKEKVKKSSFIETITIWINDKGIPIEIISGWIVSIAVFTGFTILFSIALIKIEVNTKIYFNSLYKIGVFIFYTWFYIGCFSIARDEGNRKRKNIHMAFLLFYCFMIFLSFSKESILVLFATPLKNENIYNVCRLFAYGLDSMKEAMLASIIFDTYKSIVVQKSDKGKPKTQK